MQIEDKYSRLDEEVSATNPSAVDETDQNPISSIDLSLPIELIQDNFQFMVQCAISLPQWQSAEGRIKILDDAFEKNSRRFDILGQINIDGSPRGVAVRTISALNQFGYSSSTENVLRIYLYHIYKLMDDGNTNKAKLAQFLGI